MAKNENLHKATIKAVQDYALIRKLRVGVLFCPKNKNKHSKKPCTSVRIRYNNPNKIKIVP